MARCLSAAVTTANVQAVPGAVLRDIAVARLGSDGGVVRLVTPTVEGMDIATAGNKDG